MAFGFAGAGAGAAKSLEEILGQQMQQAILAQRQKEQAEQIALQTRQIEGVEEDRATNRALQTRSHDLAELKYRDEQAQQATDRNVGMDASNVLSMPGMDDAAKARELTQSVLRNPNASSAPGMLKTVEGLSRKPERDPIADHEAKARIDAKYREPKAAPRPERDPIADHEAKLKLDQRYKTNAADPSKAGEVRTKILDTAKALRDSSGRTNMTGNRLFNADYNMGWSDDPRPGSKAANAKSLYDTLKSVMTLENLSLLKGAMSDKDLLFLQSAGTSLNSSMDDPTFATELDKIIDKFEPKVGTAPPGGGGSLADLVYDPATKTFRPKGGG